MCNFGIIISTAFSVAFVIDGVCFFKMCNFGIIILLLFLVHIGIIWVLAN